MDNFKTDMLQVNKYNTKNRAVNGLNRENYFRGRVLNREAWTGKKKRISERHNFLVIITIYIYICTKIITYK